MSKVMSKVRYLMVMTLLLGAFALPPQAQSRAAAPKDKQQNSSQWTEPELAMSDEFTEMLIADLVASGFQVSQGYPMLYTQEDCIAHTYPTLKNCFQANPAAPYVVPVLKLWPEEYWDPALVNAFVETDPEYPDKDPEYTVTYRLDPREAIVIYGQMPPPGRYMGLQTWEFSEHGKWKPKDYDQWANTEDLVIPMQYLFDTIPPEDPKSRRVISLSALGDVINNVVMQRKLRELGEEDDNPFGKTLYFIITPSGSTDNAIRLALQAQGIPDGKIFTEQIPRRDDFDPIGPLGMGKNAIDFFTAFRYAVPDDGGEEGTPSYDWRKAPPLSVLRVRAPDYVGPVERHKSLSFVERTANSELYLESDLQELVDAVCDSVSTYAGLTSADCALPPPASSFLVDLVRDYGWTGPYCRDIGMDCLGDQQEAAYFFSSPRQTDDGEVYAVVSTLATETDNAIYVGLSANDASIMGGVPDGTLLDTELKGSANIYAGTVGNTDKFFVHYFTKDCDILANVPEALENCTEISGMSTIGDPDLQGQIMISLRDYIAPGTTSGPDSNLLLTPRIISFTQP